MPVYRVLMVVTNKEAARDPEGETLAHELRKQGYSYIVSLRAGKSYIVDIEAASAEKAILLVKELASRSRLYNPVVHDLRVLLLAENSRGKVSGD